MVRGVLVALVEVNYWYFKLAGYDLLRLLGGYLNMNELAIARAIHILSIVIWIGGVAFVTMVLIPVIRQSPYKHDQMEILMALKIALPLLPDSRSCLLVLAVFTWSTN